MGGFEVTHLAHRPGGTVTKSGREIMEILEAFDLTGCAYSAAQLAGTDRKTVARYVALRDAGADPLEAERRPRSVDGFLAKVEELVDRSGGRIRADVVHRKLTAMGYRGSERTTRRAVAEAKASWRAGHRRTYRPWTPEPGMCWASRPICGSLAAFRMNGPGTSSSSRPGPAAQWNRVTWPGHSTALALAPGSGPFGSTISATRQQRC